MKRIMVSVGVVALGAAALQTCNAQMDSKSWSISAALRGFYDDNVNTVGTGSVDTYGIEISPSVAYELPLEQTSLSLAYTFGYKYYDEEINPGSDDQDDMTHTFAMSLAHTFNERTSMLLRDSFVVGQEPDFLEDYSQQRISGDNVRNFASASLSHQFTPTFGTQVGYRNNLFDYDDEGRSDYLDRMEHHINLDGRWTLANSSVFIVGYGFSTVGYNGDGVIGVGPAVPPAAPTIYDSDSRDYNAHYGYLGLERTFRPGLVGNFRVGARYSDYYNSPDDETSVSPYLESSLTYTYRPESYIQFGTRHDRTATDRFSVNAADDSITTDADTTVIYASVNHAFTPKFSGGLNGQFQNSTFNGGGSLDDESEQFYTFTGSLKYQFTPNIAATASYSFDHLDSKDTIRYGGSYDRNRVFLGAVFTY